MKKNWWDFIYKLGKDMRVKHKFPGFKIRKWYYVHVYKRKELKDYRDEYLVL